MGDGGRSEKDVKPKPRSHKAIAWRKRMTRGADLCKRRSARARVTGGQTRHAHRKAAIFREILKQRRCHIVVASFAGLDENDPIIALLRASGATVADLQFPKSAFDANDYIPSRDHVGAFATHALFEDLLQALLVSGLVPNNATSPRTPE